MLVKMQTSTSSNVVGLYQRQRSFLSCRLLALVKLQAFTSCRVALYLHVVNEFLFNNTAGFSTLALVKLQVVAEFKLRYRIIFSQGYRIIPWKYKKMSNESINEIFRAITLLNTFNGCFKVTSLKNTCETFQF